MLFASFLLLSVVSVTLPVCPSFVIHSGVIGVAMHVAISTIGMSSCVLHSLHGAINLSCVFVVAETGPAVCLLNSFSADRIAHCVHYLHTLTPLITKSFGRGIFREKNILKLTACLPFPSSNV